MAPLTRYGAKKKKRKRGSPLTNENKRLLEELYTNLNSPAGYSSPLTLWRESVKKSPEITLSQVKHYLAGKEAYTFHRRVFTNFKRRKVIVPGIDKQWQADLVDFSAIAAENDNYKYILSVIDVFSRKAWVLGLLNKKTESVAETFDSLIQKTKRRPEKLQTDDGKEFTGKVFQDMLKENGIIHFSTNMLVKAQIVERFNRTFKNIVHRYFTEKKSLRYIDRLQQFQNNYNSKPHRSLGGLAPDRVNLRNEREVFNLQYGKYLSERAKKTRFKINDTVRLSSYRKTFARGYTKNYTSEIFTIADILYTNPVTFRVLDKNGELVDGVFYEREIVPARST